MALSGWDWAVIAAYLGVSLAFALRHARKAGTGLEQYFLSGRSLGWLLAGTAGVAVTFAADTPLAVTELVARHGIAGNWLWCSQAFGGVLTVFLFSKLWRRAGVLTDVEFTELRYSGKPAAFLRAFRAAYLALPINLIIMGWVNLAMVTVLRVALDWEKTTAVWACFGLTTLYTAAAGFGGAVASGVFQLVFALFGCLVLAVVAVSHAGGMAAVLDGAVRNSPLGPDVLALFPRAHSAWMPWATFGVYVGISWWASWFPGGEPGGGGYVAQRVFASKDEKEAVKTSLWFTTAHFWLRPLTWVPVALVSIAMFPGLARPGEGYIRVMMAVLSSPLKGLLVAAFAAAYMSTISAHLNWGASYLVNDLYRRFLAKGREERHYVLASYAAVLLMGLLSFVVTGWMDSIAKAWMLLIALGAGSGAVYILRWYWWRVNAYSEIAAMVAAGVISLALQSPLVGLSMDSALDYGLLLLLTTAGTTMIWIAVTLLTKPEPAEVLEKFYARVAPSPQGWAPVAGKVAKTDHPPIPLKESLLSWGLGCVCLYSVILLTGYVLVGLWGRVAFLALLAAGSGWGLARAMGCERSGLAPAESAPAGSV